MSPANRSDWDCSLSPTEIRSCVCGKSQDALRSIHGLLHIHRGTAYNDRRARRPRSLAPFAPLCPGPRNVRRRPTRASSPGTRKHICRNEARLAASQPLTHIWHLNHFAHIRAPLVVWSTLPLFSSVAPGVAVVLGKSPALAMVPSRAHPYRQGSSPLPGARSFALQLSCCLEGDALPLRWRRLSRRLVAAL